MKFGPSVLMTYKFEGLVLALMSGKDMIVFVLENMKTKIVHIQNIDAFVIHEVTRN